MTKTSFPANLITTSNEVIVFAATDSKARVIGAQIKRIEADWIETPQGQYGYVNDRRGLWFGFEPHATRNNQRYGAVQQWRWFATIEAREAAIAKYLADANKRAAKFSAGLATPQKSYVDVCVDLGRHDLLED